MSAEGNPRRVWLAVVTPGVFVALLNAGISCFEALHVGPFADPEVVDAYHFGSEAMVDAGGWRYASRALYVGSAALEAICLMLVAALLTLAIIRRRLLWAVGGYLGLATVLIVVTWSTIEMVVGAR